MTLCADVRDAMRGKENPAARGSKAAQLYLNYGDGSSLQRQGFIGINYIATASLNRSWRGTENCRRQKEEKLTLHNSKWYCSYKQKSSL